MEKIKKLRAKIEDFCDRHRGVICYTFGFACALATVMLHNKSPKSGPQIMQQIDDWDVDPHAESIRKIDEDIFTTVAPEIEDILFCEGLDEGRIDRDYTVSFPYRGNSENGCYDVVKHVMVLVQDTCQDCD